uniref:Sema domain-containing protein n=1 Tax=Callorhinchus milii TaxID=7868 RepID=A0A4W3GRQ2_CALMI
MTGIVNINGRPAVIGTFSTQANSIPGSAVCAFYMEDIATAFRGRFQEQRPGDAAWIPVPEDRVPTPRYLLPTPRSPSTHTHPPTHTPTHHSHTRTRSHTH